jgi:hypothetical protein
VTVLKPSRADLVNTETQKVFDECGHIILRGQQFCPML